MLNALELLLVSMVRSFRSRRNLLLENLALRQQLAVLKRKYPRPRPALFDKLFWVLARRFWSGWKQRLVLVSPETVVRWHRAGFALSLVSRRWKFTRVGRYAAATNVSTQLELATEEKRVREAFSSSDSDLARASVNHHSRARCGRCPLRISQRC